MCARRKPIRMEIYPQENNSSFHLRHYEKWKKDDYSIFRSSREDGY